MISSILFPRYFEPDFRPLIILILTMTFFVAIIIAKNWHYIKNYINSEWEL